MERLERTQMTFNAIAAVIDGLRVHPEPQSLPESLLNSEPVELAGAHNRFKEIAAVANGLAKATGEALAAKIPYGALRYGDTIYRPAGGRGDTKVIDEGKWWPKVIEGLRGTDRPEVLLSELFTASGVKMGGMDILANVLGEDPKVFRKEHIRYEKPTGPLSVMPLDKAPKWAQHLDEGQISTVREA